MKRRDFIATVSLGLAAGLPGITESVTAAAEPVDTTAHAAGNAARLEFVSAVEAAEAIRKKQISSIELTQQIFARIDKYNSKLNAFAYQLREDATARAKQADEERGRGKSLGPLHGVPIHVKESFAVAGHPCTWESPRSRTRKRRKTPKSWSGS